MKLVFYFLLWFILLVVPYPLLAQQTAADSLLAKIDKEPSDSLKAVYYYKLASTTYLQDANRAQEWANKGMQLTKERKLKDLDLDFLNLSGVIYLKLNEYDKSIETHFKVLKLREAKGDKKGMVRAFMNIGNVFNKSGDTKQALRYYQESLTLAEQIRDNQSIGNLYNNISNIYSQDALDNGKPDAIKQAVQYLLKTIQFAKKNVPDQDLSNTYILLSYVYLKDDKLELSKKYTDLAVALTDKTKDKLAGSYARINRANILVKQGLFEEATQEVARIKKLIRESGLDYLNDEFSTDFEKIAKAVKEKDTSVLLTDKDSLLRVSEEEAGLQRLKVREELREKYESEKKDLENKNLLLENRSIEQEANRIKILWVATGAIVLILAMLFVLIRKKNHLLNEERERLLEANEEIRQQTEMIKEQHRSLMEAERFRSRIFSVVSHDLRAPISTFQSLLSFSKIAEIPPEDIRSSLLKIGLEVNIASTMLDELLVWSAGQMSSEELRLVPIEVREIVQSSQLLFQERITMKSLALINDVSDTLVVQGDRKRFEFIIRNLISNAIKFSFTGRPITIGAEQSDTELQIYVKDEGVGMSEEQLLSLKSISTKKSHPGTWEEKGTGLGLLLCDDFAARMGWSISVSSQEGFGSIFYIHIPLSDIR
ncbi:ATPase/histidine kinase/DNA gyrase B/HSP90 domain protein [Sphingobacterium spiritivorum ATCC 33300]|uniref:histidine kinase n=1 Tax=Sphingobacterium spiritivorum ATCC 33300 TaxID=525372 RepID=C2FVL9_SPHSI|nr:tetratricopeptide repeat-containing sensor histidine kinase [Sphingobacterium spiritivorum]EEI93077.1 ATPase/histidine kinase/DNA gyrase B/HSP90 domain protein [Sphingobacterium spiritivorum ATCC 33300]QQS96220.1 tetratricopeptide repeat-containing sensor histidine kinase [Sphingobacterium spiritivorum]